MNTVPAEDGREPSDTPIDWVIDPHPIPADIEDTLIERSLRYGAFSTHALLTQELKLVMSAFDGGRPWHTLTHSQREALEMIAHKIGRILNGDPNYDDSWRDIAGYATLVVKQLEGHGV